MVQPIWHHLPLCYVERLSRSSLAAQDAVFVAGDVILSSHDPQPPHWHDAYELGLVLKGSGCIAMGEHAYAYAPGQIYIINDLDPHMGYAESEESLLFAIHFHPCILESGWIGQMRQEVRTPFLSHFGQEGPLLPLDHPLTLRVRTILEEIRTEVQQSQTL